MLAMNVIERANTELAEMIVLNSKKEDLLWFFVDNQK